MVAVFWAQHPLPKEGDLIRSAEPGHESSEARGSWNGHDEGKGSEGETRVSQASIHNTLVMHPHNILRPENSE